MTFVFIGIDGLDYNLWNEFGLEDELGDDCPVQFRKLEQNLPDVISEQGQGKLNTGHWTFYVWPAIASGQVLTPEMRQEHPSPNNVEYPLKKKYLRHAPRSLLRYVSGRLRRRPRYKSFVWDSFENVKVVNYPLHLPEYNENAELFRDDAMSRDYGPKELELLQAEINNAVRENYDAVFVVTRIVDTKCHGATHPANFGGKESVDEWFESSLDKSFEEIHENGMDVNKLAENMEIDIDPETRQDSIQIKQEILDHVETSYREVVKLLSAVNWESVDNHVVVSDHGFDALGAGSVNAHGRNAVLSCSFGYWRKMSAFIESWRPALMEAVEQTGEDEEQVFEGGKSEDDKIKEELEALGYNV